jgi:hypothetical protein
MQPRVVSTMMEKDRKVTSEKGRLTPHPGAGGMTPGPGEPKRPGRHGLADLQRAALARREASAAVK